MQKSFFIFFILYLLVGCSFIESKSFYETFINPDLDIKIDNEDNIQAPDLESVPGSNE
tara:strand:- start:19 stop:192 length:174 start_codon:yes stop_codon:yes gene_type:complete